MAGKHTRKTRDYIPVELIAFPESIRDEYLPASPAPGSSPRHLTEKPKLRRTPETRQKTEPDDNAAAKPNPSRNEQPSATGPQLIAGNAPPKRYSSEEQNAGAASISSTVSSGSLQPSPSASGGLRTLNRGAYAAVHRLSRLPAFLTRTEPSYPPDERLAGREARVLAEIYLNEHGGVDEISIKRSQGALFDNAVTAAIRSSRFQPGYQGDKPVPTVIQIPYVFKMR